MVGSALALVAALTSPHASAASAWRNVEQTFTRVALPPGGDLKAASSGTRAWRVRFVGNTLEVSPQPLNEDAVPFSPDIDTASMGSYSTRPLEALRTKHGWFLAYYHGEFGGALWQFSADGSVGSRLLGQPTYDLVAYKDEVLAATGSAAPFFFSPLRIHRFAFRNGAWMETGHTDFHDNIAALTNVGGRLFGMVFLRDRSLALGALDLSGHVRFLWNSGSALYVSNIAVAANGDMALGAHGYVVRLHRRGNVYDATWYAPRDCVRYSASSTDAYYARCVGARGVAAYEHHATMPAYRFAATSSNGEWLAVLGGLRLLHFVDRHWIEHDLPAVAHAFVRRVEDVHGSPLIQLVDSLWVGNPAGWARIGPPGACGGVLVVASTMNWCLADGPTQTTVTGISIKGSVVTATIAGQSQVFAPGLAGDLWIAEAKTNILDRIDSAGTLQHFQLASPATNISHGDDAVWFSESDRHHYGLIDATNAVRELTYASNDSIQHIAGARQGAWLIETFPGNRTFVRHLNAVGSVNGPYVADVRGYTVTDDGAIWAQSDNWPTIVRTSEDGASVNSFRLPCEDIRGRLVHGPRNSVWFLSNEPRCSAFITSDAIQQRDLPSIDITTYK